MEIKILDAMKSLHMLRLHRIKTRNGGEKHDMRIPACCQRKKRDEGDKLVNSI
jgi:hypothetical protein